MKLLRISIFLLFPFYVAIYCGLKSVVRGGKISTNATSVDLLITRVMRGFMMSCIGSTSSSSSSSVFFLGLLHHVHSAQTHNTQCSFQPPATLHFEDKAFVYVLCKISLWQVSVCQKLYNLY